MKMKAIEGLFSFSWKGIHFEDKFDTLNYFSLWLWGVYFVVTLVIFYK